MAPDETAELRRALAGVEEVQAAGILVEFLQKHKTNAEALAAVD